MEKKLINFIPYLSALSGVSFDFLNLHIRLDQIYGVFMFLYISFRLVLNKNEKFRINSNVFFLLFLWALSFFSSFQNAPDSKYSIIQTINLATISLYFIIIYNTIKSIRQLKDFLNSCFNVCISLSAVATIFFLISIILKRELYGISLVQSEFHPFGIMFTMGEPNIYGSFMMVYFFIAFGLLQNNTYNIVGFTKKKIQLVIFFAGLGVLLSFTRGVWLALIVCLFFFYFNPRKMTINRFVQLNLVLISVVFSYIFFTYFLGIKTFQYKLDNFLSINGGTGEGRVFIWLGAIDNWLEQKNYWLGNGTYSFAAFFNNNNNETNAWIGNLLITFLHDTGIIGLLIFFIFFFRLVKKTFIKKPFFLNNLTKINFYDLQIGLRFAAIGIFIAFFFTPALTYSFPWILFGLIESVSNLKTVYNKCT